MPADWCWETPQKVAYARIWPQPAAGTVIALEVAMPADWCRKTSQKVTYARIWPPTCSRTRSRPWRWPQSHSAHPRTSTNLWPAPWRWPQCHPAHRELQARRRRRVTKNCHQLVVALEAAIPADQHGETLSKVTYAGIWTQPAVVTVVALEAACLRTGAGRSRRR